jgi:hypothetical protein
MANLANLANLAKMANISGIGESGIFTGELGTTLAPYTSSQASTRSSHSPRSPRNHVNIPGGVVLSLKPVDADVTANRYNPPGN